MRALLSGAISDDAGYSDILFSLHVGGGYNFMLCACLIVLYSMLYYIII